MADREIRRRRTRSKIQGTNEIPRLNVCISNSHIYGQIINDVTGETILSCSDMQKDSKIKGKNIEIAKELGFALAKKAKEKKIEKVVFDRGFRIYHGRVAAFAEGAREGGLLF